MVNDQSSHFDLKGFNGWVRTQTSAVAGLLYGDSSHGVHIPNSDDIVKLFIERIEKLFDKIRNSENGDEDIAKVKTTISNVREAIDINYKSGLIKEDDFDLLKKIVDEIEVSLDK